MKSISLNSHGGGTVGKSICLQAEGWVFKSQPPQVQVITIGSDSSTDTQ